MTAIMPVLNRFMADEAGASAIEYGLLAAMFGVVALMAAASVGNGLASLWNGLSGGKGAGGAIGAATNTL